MIFLDSTNGISLTETSVPACIVALVGISRTQPRENVNISQHHWWAELSLSAGPVDVSCSPGARCALVGSVSPQQGSLRSVKADLRAADFITAPTSFLLWGALFYMLMSPEITRCTHNEKGPHTDTDSCPYTHSVTVCEASQELCAQPVSLSQELIIMAIKGESRGSWKAVD